MSEKKINKDWENIDEHLESFKKLLREGDDKLFKALFREGDVELFKALFREGDVELFKKLHKIMKGK